MSFLQPRDALDLIATLNEPAQVLNRRGAALVLKSDLTVNFARAISRGGAATNNIKRYELGKCFLESDAGGHPKGEFKNACLLCIDQSRALLTNVHVSSLKSCSRHHLT